MKPGQVVYVSCFCSWFKTHEMHNYTDCSVMMWTSWYFFLYHFLYRFAFFLGQLEKNRRSVCQWGSHAVTLSSAIVITHIHTDTLLLREDEYGETTVTLNLHVKMRNLAFFYMWISTECKSNSDSLLNKGVWRRNTVRERESRNWSKMLVLYQSMCQSRQFYSQKYTHWPL